MKKSQELVNKSDKNRQSCEKMRKSNKVVKKMTKSHTLM